MALFEKSTPHGAPVSMHGPICSRGRCWRTPPHHTKRHRSATCIFTNADRFTYLDCLATYCRQARVRILSYCLMTNHIHLVAVPEEPQSLAVALRRTHGRYALYLNTRRQRKGHLWQNRFYSCALGRQHLWVALRYVEMNPVRANLVTRPENYPWSSAAAHLGFSSRTGFLDWNFYEEVGGLGQWQELLARPEELAEVRALQHGTFTGRPVGDAEFMADLEHKLGRRLPSKWTRKLSVLNAKPMRS